MILCVNPNAAIDKTVVVSQFRLNEIHRPQQVVAIPGGKGCNVARALKCLGEVPTVSGWVGGFAGQFIEAGLRREDIEAAFVQTAFELRTCLSILDPDNHTLTELYEKGDPVPTEKVDEFIRLFPIHRRAVYSRYAVGQFAAGGSGGFLQPVDPDCAYGRRSRAAGYQRGSAKNGRYSKAAPDQAERERVRRTGRSCTQQHR